MQSPFFLDRLVIRLNRFGRHGIGSFAHIERIHGMGIAQKGQKWLSCHISSVSSRSILLRTFNCSASQSASH
jgi:hypothetical protein